MKAARTNPSFLFFCSGIFAAVAINLVTGLAGQLAEENPYYVLYVALPWLLAAAAIAYTSTIVEAKHTKLAMLISPSLAKEEVDSLTDSTLAPIEKKVRFSLFVCAFSIAVGFVLPFHLVDGWDNGKMPSSQNVTGEAAQEEIDAERDNPSTVREGLDDEPDTFLNDSEVKENNFESVIDKEPENDRSDQ